MLKKERMMKPTSFSSTPNARYANGRRKGWRETGHSPYLSASGRHQRAPATNPRLQATHTDSAFRLQSSYDPSISRQHSTFGHVRRPAQTHSLSKSRAPIRASETQLRKRVSNSVGFSSGLAFTCSLTYSETPIATQPMSLLTSSVRR